MGHGWADMATALAGYRFFQQDLWRWPLLAIPMLGLPDGTNVTFTDGIPILALAGRLIFKLTGAPVNLSGLWIGLCLWGSALSLTLLVRLLGARSLAAAIAAGLIGFTMPSLLFRWGHPALMAQYEITLALALYVWRLRDAPALSGFAATAALSTFALLTNSYLFLMVGSIIAAAYAQLIWMRPVRVTKLLPEMAILGLILGSVMLACGLLGSGGSLRTVGYGVFSANILGPFIPQRSGLVPSMSYLVVDGTGGQYEGFCYLGAGLLLLAAMALPDRATWQRVGHHKFLAGILTLMALLSLSSEIYAGPWHITTLPMPAVISAALEIVRSSGRFTWPPLYAAASLAIVSAATRPRGAVLLLAAVALQWVDTGPLRHDIASEISTPVTQPVDFGVLRALMSGHSSVIVIPSFACLSDPAGWSKTLTLEVELAAAAAFVATNTVYQSRHSAHCTVEQREAALPTASDSVLRIYLPEWQGFRALSASANQNCAATSRVVICTDKARGDVLREATRAMPGWQAPVDEPWLEGAADDQRR